MTTLEIFEAIAEDNATVSYLARWSKRTWIVLRRGRTEEATRQLAAMAGIARGLGHPNVVRTLDPGHDLPDLQHSVLFEEYVHGDRVEVWLYARAVHPLPWRVATAIVRDAAQGASAIQAAVNGNPRAASELWPGRLVVGVDGVVRIVDSCAELRGVALPPDVRARFCAPELNGGGGPLGLGAAVFALGRTLAELCITDRTDELHAAPKALERVLVRATHPTPSERYRSAAELAIALDALLDEPNPVRPYYDGRRAAEREAAAHGGEAVRNTLESATLAPVTQRLKQRRASKSTLPIVSGPPVAAQPGRHATLVSLQAQRAAPSSDQQLPLMARPGAPSSVPIVDPGPPASSSSDHTRLDAPNTNPMYSPGPITLQELPDLEDDYDEAEHDELLSLYVADAREDELTLPLRRELLAKLQHDENVVLENGGARVAVKAAHVHYTASMPDPVADKVVVLPPPAASDPDLRRRAPRAPDSATVLVRRPVHASSGSSVLVPLVCLLLLGAALWAYLGR